MSKFKVFTREKKQGLDRLNNIFNKKWVTYKKGFHLALNQDLYDSFDSALEALKNIFYFADSVEILQNSIYDLNDTILEYGDLIDGDNYECNDFINDKFNRLFNITKEDNDKCEIYEKFDLVKSGAVDICGELHNNLFWLALGHKNLSDFNDSVNSLIKDLNDYVLDYWSEFYELKGDEDSDDCGDWTEWIDF